MEHQIRGDRIEKLMKDQGWEPGQLAYKSSVSTAQVYRLLANERPKAQATTVAKIASALRTSTDYLLGLTAIPVPLDDTTEPTSDLEWQLLQRFRELSQEEQHYIIAQLDLMLHVLTRPPFGVIGDE